MRMGASAVLLTLVLGVGLGASACDLDGGTISEKEQRALAKAARDTDTRDKGQVVKTVRTHEQIPAPSRTRRTERLRRGVTKMSRPGRDGVRLKVYRVTMRDGRVMHRELVRSRVVRRPVATVTLLGTRSWSAVPRNAPCDSNYSGRCVPFASDVDCAGGSGDGPGYVSGPVRVTGIDVYGLDPDGDGWGCE